MKYIKYICGIACVCLVLMLLVGCSKKTDIKIAESDYLAQGTIPSAAKIYPICDEKLPMLIAYKDEIAQQSSFTTEDINEITTKIDKLVGLCANSAADDYEPVELDFLTGISIEDISQTISDRNTKALLNGCQIITLTGLGQDKAEAVVMLNATLLSDQQEHINLWYVGLQKTGGVWYIIGSQTALTGLTADYQISRDTATGQIICTKIGGD